MTKTTSSKKIWTVVFVTRNVMAKTPFASKSEAVSRARELRATFPKAEIHVGLV